jgi:hypothetical protein
MSHGNMKCRAAWSRAASVTMTRSLVAAVITALMASFLTMPRLASLT